MSAANIVGASLMRAKLEHVAELEGLSLNDLTVLAVQNDPFRLDTPANHRLGEWLAMQIDDLGISGRRIHSRGLHYVVLDRPKPNRVQYLNIDPDWKWMSEKVVKAARFLGYVPWDQIVDQRNAAPVVRRRVDPDPHPYVNVDLDVQIPDAYDLQPRARISGVVGVQPYQLVLYGEKSSLEQVLGPVAARYDADLYLPTGEISDTMMHQMARDAAVDGRPLVVITFSDCDPAGWQMPVSISRKLQAFQTTLFPELQFEVHRAALTPDQVREYGLPSTPLKDTERRADRWKREMGVDQTEIDALGSLRPDLLTEIAREALDPFFDHDLDHRVSRAVMEWEDHAQALVDQAVAGHGVDALRADAVDKLDEIRVKVAEIVDGLQFDAASFNLPEIWIPDAEVPGGAPDPLVSSQWSFGDQCRALIRSKAYGSAVTR